MSFGIRRDFFQRFDIRLTLYYTGVCITIFIGVYLFFYFDLKRSLTEQVDNILRDEFHELSQELNDTHFQGLPLKTGCVQFMEDVSGRKFFPISFRVFSSKGELIFQSDRSMDIPFPDTALGTETLTLDDPGGDPIRIHQRTVLIRPSGERLLIQLATKAGAAAAILRQWLTNALLVLPLLLLACIGGGVLVSQRPKKIISRITGLTRRISSQNLKERLAVPRPRDEIQDLTMTINSMLDRLDASFSQIRQFTADVSHEMRNPLFSLQGELEVAISRKRTPEAYEEIIGNCIERTQFLFKMVKELFMIASFDTNQVPLELSRMDIGDLLGDIHGFFLPLAQEKKIRFTLDAPESAMIEADRTKLLQLLNNLLENAVKFTPENGEIHLFAVGLPHQVQICVRDTGIGIPDQELEKVFNRFYQVDRSRSGFNRGTGLGLHICQRIAEIHNGKIHVRPNAGPGVCFTVTLPLGRW